MRNGSDEGISDMVSTILIIILVIALAAFIGAALLGIPFFLQKPVLAAFSADVVMGADGSHALTVPTIHFTQLAGDPLTQNYTTHTKVEETRVKIFDPTGKMYEVAAAYSMTGKLISKGQSYYIFHTVTGEPYEYWLTNAPSRIFYGPPENGVVEPFLPHGKWRFVITDEKSTNMVLYQKDLTL